MNNAVLRACLGRDTVNFSVLLFCSSAIAQEATILRMAVPSSIESSGPALKKPGHANANLIIPDAKSESIMYEVDRNDDGKPDVVFFDLKQQKKWDISLWDEKFEGHWTLVGYHPDGKMTPSSFESYEKFRSRVAAR